MGIAILLLLTSEAPARASEYGISTYRPGLMDVYAGLLPPAGTVMLKDQFMYQHATAGVITEDGRIEANTSTDSYTDAIFLGYVTNLTILGGRYAFGTLQMARIAAQSARVGPFGVPMREQKLTVGGIGDGIFMPVILGWDFGQFHIAGSFAFYAPTGNYDPNSIISIGLNRWAFEPDVGLTWMNESRYEASMFVGYTINTKNPADDYTSGNEFHVDFAFVRHLPNGIMLGTAGYAFQQTTPDTGSGALLGGFEGRVIGLGPIVGYTVPLGGHRAVELAFKYDFEFAAQNRSQGNELWFTATFHL